MMSTVWTTVGGEEGSIVAPKYAVELIGVVRFDSLTLKFKYEFVFEDLKPIQPIIAVPYDSAGIGYSPPAASVKLTCP